jgi:hypothetical protein
MKKINKEVLMLSIKQAVYTYVMVGCIFLAFMLVIVAIALHPVIGLIVLGICGFTFSVIWNYADNIRLCN